MEEKDNKVEEKVVEVEEQKRNNELLNNRKKVNGKAFNIWVIVILIVFMLFIFGLGVCLGKELFADNNKNKEKNNNSNNIQTNNNQINNNQSNNNQTDNNQTNNNQENNNQENNNQSNNEILEEEKIMEQFNKIIVSNEKVFSNDKFNVNDLSIDEILVTVFSKMDIDSICLENSKSAKITIDELNNSINKYINKTLSFDDVKKLDHKSVGVGGQYDYEYGIIINNSNIEVIDKVCGSEGGFEIFTLKKIINYEKKDDNIYLYSKIVFGQNDDSKVKYYSDFNKRSGVIESFDGWYDYLGGAQVDENISPDYDRYNTYKFTFKIIDGIYYFKTVELIK